jgi:hypothetical protein
MFANKWSNIEAASAYLSNDVIGVAAFRQLARHKRAAGCIMSFKCTQINVLYLKFILWGIHAGYRGKILKCHFIIAIAVV